MKKKSSNGVKEGDAWKRKKTGWEDLKGQKEHVGNVSHGPKHHCSFVTRMMNMWYIYHIGWVDMQGQEFNVGNVSHGPKNKENVNNNKNGIKNNEW